MSRRLFWKIFLPFWAAQALLLGALYLRLHYRLHSERPWWIQPERQTMAALGELAAKTYEEGQEPALRNLLEQISLKDRVSYFLLDLHGKELSGRPMSQRCVNACLPAAHYEGILRSFEPNVLVKHISTAKANYVFVGEFIPPPLSERVPGDILWSLKLGTLISALVCFLIAHYLSKPIERLRDATHELARGNLHIRAGQNIGARRDEIADLVRDFDTMAEELRNLIQSERNLLSGVSHELRSPIARIRLALTLARGGEGPEQEEMFDRIEQDTIQLDSMLERILTVARLESGQQKAQFEPLSLNDIVENVLHDACFEAAACHAEINFDGDGDIQLNGDASMLRSGIENVVRNAIFYSGEGGKISIRLRQSQGKAILTVRDNGPGVPPEVLPLIFKPFYRVDDARGAKTGGMGLGLAIVSRSIAAHGGTVVARNLLPHGLEVEIQLPALLESVAPRPPEPRLLADAQTPSPR